MMAAGQGRVQRAIQSFIAERTSALLEERDSEYRVSSVTTADLCGAAFNTAVVTKAQRVAVLRALKQIDIKKGMPPNTHIVRQRNRRQWFIVYDEYSAPPKQPKRKSRRNTKLAAVVRMLGSDKQGERDAALLAMQRVMKKEGLDWNDMAAAFESKLSDP
jgi:hypothetical protein